MPMINGKTKIVAVLGHPIAHTASPAMHNAAFAALKMNWAYIAVDVDPSNLKAALHGLALSGLVGVNLTVPHKLLALRLLKKAHPSARDLHATNTIQFLVKGAKVAMEGHNTDGYGLLAALDEAFAFNPKGKTISIVGCGGAGQGAAIQFAKSGVKKLILINRTASKARNIARMVHHARPGVICSFRPEKCDLAIQATSLGLKSTDPLPVSREMLNSLKPDFFYDMIYRPAQTPAMKLAGKMQIRTANGLGMLLHQGARAFEIWTGRKAPVGVMRKALYSEIYGR